MIKKTIPDFPNYAVTKDGRIWSKLHVGLSGHRRKGRWLNPYKIKKSYFAVCLFRNTRKRHIRCVHRLVLETYVGNRPENMECRHLDGNKENNNLNNLKWGTRSENQQDAVRHGTHPGFKSKGENCGTSKLKEQDVRLIFSSYWDGAHNLSELAKHFDVTRPCIANIIYKRTWKHLWSNDSVIEKQKNS